MQNQTENDLLEALARPDNLVEYQLEREIATLATFRDQLIAVEKSINASVAPVLDGPGDAIAVSVQTAERRELFDLAATSDSGFNKFVTVFTALCEEVEFLKATAKGKFYAQLMLFGHSKNDDADEYQEGLLEAMMGRSLPLFQDAANFANRLNEVVLNIVWQLQAVHSSSAGFSVALKEVKLRPVYLALGDALAVLLTLDTIIEGNSMISKAWEKFKHVAAILRTDPARYGTDPEKSATFDALLNDLDFSVASGNLLRRCLDQQFEVNVGISPAYRDSIRTRSTELITEFLTKIGSETETSESWQLVGQFCVYALYRMLPEVSGKSSLDVLKKQFEFLWKTQEQVPFVVLYSRLVFTADAFLFRFCSVPGLAPGARSLIPANPIAARGKYADTLEAALPAQANLLHSRVSAWLVRAQMAFADAPLLFNRQPPMEIVRARAVLVNQALYLAAGGQRLFSNFLCSQLSLGRDFKRKVIEPLTRICELLKVLEGSARSYSSAIAEATPFIHRDNAIAIMELMLPLRLRAASAAKNKIIADEQIRFVAASAELIQDLVIGTESWTTPRRIALDIALSVVAQKVAGQKEAENAELSNASSQLSIFHEFQPMMRSFCDCSLLYWVREILPAMVGVVCTVDGTAGTPDSDSRHGSRLQFVFTAYSDAARVLSVIIHLPPPPIASRRLVSDPTSSAAAVQASTNSTTTTTTTTTPTGVELENGLFNVEHLLTAYERFLHGIIQTDIIQPLVRAVETDLRVMVHAVHLAHMEPPSLRTGKPPLVHLLGLPPIRVVGILVDIKAEVTHALEKDFYELTTVALHDWKTYGEMASLAAHKYGINLADNHLPMGCLDQGLDVLQIMRNIHVFVARYDYNMNQQFFVEKKVVKGSKHINIVTTQSISSSIRQHGTGMMNTTVNFAYQYLSQKFQLFVQFLHDDYIKSYLSKERRFFRRERKALDNRYPFDHAVGLNKDIRSLGLTPDKLSFLDKFRSLISEVGNALGYVRMVRSAGMRSAAEAVKFVPDLDDIKSFADQAKSVSSQQSSNGKGLSQETLDAAQQLDDVLKNLTASFAEGSDYFKLLVTVFQHGILGRNSTSSTSQSTNSATSSSGTSSSSSIKEDHLRNFFLIIPSLTLSFVESLRSAKDRVEKGIKGTESYFCDDGFAMGIAYILSILRQNRQFDSLHWFDSVRQHHRSELSAYKAELASISEASAAQAAKVKKMSSSQQSQMREQLEAQKRADLERAEELDFRAKRVLAQQVEYDQLYYAFCGARSFFQTADTNDDDEAFVGL
jgi:WASH complex subunit 7